MFGLNPARDSGRPFPKSDNGISIKRRESSPSICAYPDSSQDRKGYNPINYPDLKFKYTIKTEAVGNSIKLTVNLEEPLPRGMGK